MSKQLLILSNFQTLKEYPKLVYNSIIIIFLPTFDFRFSSISFSVIIRIESKSKIIAYGVICCSYNLIIIKSLFTVKTFGHGPSNLDFSPTPIRHGLSKENFCVSQHRWEPGFTKTKQKVAYRVSKQVLD